MLCDSWCSIQVFDLVRNVTTALFSHIHLSCFVLEDSPSSDARYEGFTLLFCVWHSPYTLSLSPLVSISEINRL